MPNASRVPSRPATPGGYAQLNAGKAYLERTGGSRLLRRITRRGFVTTWLARLVVTVVALVVLWRVFLAVVGIVTNLMWFDSVHAGSVYKTSIEARILLFAVFGVIGGLVGGATLVLLRRIRPLPLSADDDTFRWTFRKYEHKASWLLVVLAVAIPGYLVGVQAQAGWQTYLLWLHAKPFHTTDPTFHKDVSFFVEVYPFHTMVVALLLQAVSYGLWIAAIGGYWYGAFRLRRGRRKVTRGFTRLLSLLLGGFLVLEAVNYWLARYGLTTSARGPVTGTGYTDTTAGIPSKYVLLVLALIAAGALLANAFRWGRVRVLAATVVVMLVASPLLGSVWPGLLYHYRESPSAAKADLPEIAHNQKATLAAFGLDGAVTTQTYDSTQAVNNAAALTQLASATAQTPVIDPNQLSPTFTVQQQLQAYYGFKSTLDLANYDVGGRSQDVALAVRELRAAGIPQQSWVNSHLVYTHGYGVVAAPTTEVDPKTAGPVYLDGGMPPSQEIPVSRPQVYFGQGFASGSYAVVGQPAGSTRKLEFDHPAGSGAAAAHTTYRGKGGIPIGSAAQRLLFAVQFGDPSLFFSSELNSASQLLEVRDPRTRVAKVAPWLTLDGDVYPAVVDGQIKWIVDGYTTSGSYPDSQLVNLHTASATTLTANGASVAQPNTQVNYMQNSVKAVVDAYTGKVTLYEWNQQQHPDSLLKAWESVYPGLVQPQSSIPSALTPQLRYPTDLFNVQRSLLARYHVTQPSNFYSGNDFWSVPTDPTVAASKSIGSSRGASSAPLPSRYMSMSADGTGSQRYSLSSPMGTLNGRQLAAFLSVDSTPGPDYGRFTVLRFPSNAGGESPSQVQNDIESDTAITEALTLQRGGNSKVVLGDLVAVPIAGRMLYVEPVYTQSNGNGSFPVLRHVIAQYANGQPSFDDTLAAALKNAFASAAGTSR